MIKVDFSNIWMSKKETFALWRMRIKLPVRDSEDYDNLRDGDHADYTNWKTENGKIMPDGDKLCITEKGIAYLKYREEKFVKDYLFDIINFAIALAALIISIVR